jgi:hypothetical protein
VKRSVQAMRLLRRWHRRIGATAAVFFLLLAVSGVLLNHPDATGLDDRKVHSAMLARWYGLKPARAEEIYRAGAHELAWGNGLWLLDGRIVAEDAPAPVGLLELDQRLYVASAESLSVFAADRRLIEKMSSAALPALPLRALGARRERVCVQDVTGAFCTADGVSWQPAADGGIAWSRPQPVPAALRAGLAARLVPGISLDRLLLDLHSGRIFGRYGPLVVDALGLALILLALSGVWLFFRPHRRHRG